MKGILYALQYLELPQKSSSSGMIRNLSLSVKVKDEGKLWYEANVNVRLRIDFAPGYVNTKQELLASCLATVGRSLRITMRRPAVFPRI